MTDDFLDMLRKRLADARLDQSEARGKTEQLIANALVGLAQAIQHDYEQTRPLADSNQRRRVWQRAKAFAVSPMSEISIKQGEADARLIVRYLAERGIAAVAVERAGKWIVRKQK